jgi:hypothetical protein
MNADDTLDSKSYSAKSVDGTSTSDEEDGCVIECFCGSADCPICGPRAEEDSDQ